MHFLEEYFRGMPLADSKILVWKKKGKISSYFSDPLSAANFSAGKEDLYFQAGICKEKRSDERAKKHDVNGIFAMWIDIDVYHPEFHKKAGVPKTREDAMAILDSEECKPTFVINSGYGIQAFWLLDKPWIFSDENDRNQAETDCVRWNLHFDKLAEKLGYKIDHTHDTTRLMRIPGTVNAKDPANPIGVTIEKELPYRYSREDLRAVGLKSKAGKTAEDVFGNGQRKAKPAAAPAAEYEDSVRQFKDPVDPGHRIDMAAMMQVEEFSRIWNKQASPGNDTSDSGYCYAIANMMAMAGAGIYQIIRELESWRAKNDSKPKTASWFYREAMKACQNKSKERAAASRSIEERERDEKEIAESARKALAVSGTLTKEELSSIIESAEAGNTDRLTAFSVVIGAGVAEISAVPGGYNFVMANGRRFCISKAGALTPSVIMSSLIHCGIPSRPIKKEVLMRAMNMVIPRIKHRTIAEYYNEMYKRYILSSTVHGPGEEIEASSLGRPINLGTATGNCAAFSAASLGKFIKQTSGIGTAPDFREDIEITFNKITINGFVYFFPKESKNEMERAN